MAYDSEQSERTVTRDRVMRLRDFLKTLPDERFDIADLYTRNGGGVKYAEVTPGLHGSMCGTAACIAGWANILFAPDERGAHASTAERLLGLSSEEGDSLFMPYGYIVRSAEYTRQRAVAVLDNYLATGEIDWSVAK